MWGIEPAPEHICLSLAAQDQQEESELALLLWLCSLQWGVHRKGAPKNYGVLRWLRKEFL